MSNKIKYLILILGLISNKFNSQILFEQDIVQGGITGAGFSTGLGDGLGNFSIYIEPGSTIKKAYIFTYRMGYPTNSEFIINNDTIYCDTLNAISSFNHKNPSLNPIKIYVMDYSDLADQNILNYSIKFPSKTGLPINWGYWTVYMVVVYENTTFVKNTNYSLLINDKNNLGNEIYSSINLNAVDLLAPTGLALYTDRNGGVSGFKSEVYVNSQSIGLIGGNDLVNSSFLASGVKGHFYYQDGNLFGLDDDSPNPFMDSSDALADISSYLSSQNLVNLQIKHENYPIQSEISTGINLAYFLTHSTPCDTFTVNLQDKIQVCKGDSIQMQVTSAPLSNHMYEWEPSIGLNCDTCAQPYFTDTMSRWYTVRIWNNDSCSKVLPVRVEVLDKPIDPIVSVSPTKCSDSSGTANVQVVESSYKYILNNGVPQTSNIFNNLNEGNHLVSVIDTNGCKSNTPITILETYPNAVFSATPQQGDVPLEVSFYNTSTGANNFIWYIEQDTLTSVNATHTFNSEGYFDATLVVYDTYPWCSDTASVKIFAEYPFTIFAPSLQDDKKGNYQIYTSGVKSLSYHLYNALGQIIYTKELAASQGYQTLWSAFTVAKGTYIFKIVAKGENGEEKVVSGKVVVI